MHDVQLLGALCPLQKARQREEGQSMVEGGGTPFGLFLALSVTILSSQNTRSLRFRRWYGLSDRNDRIPGASFYALLELCFAVAVPRATRKTPLLTAASLKILVS